MGKEIVNQVQEAQRVPYRINPRRNTPRHIVIKMAKIKDKEKLLKAAREKQQITYTEQSKEKRMKRIEDSLRNTVTVSGTTLNAPTFELQGSQKKKRKRKGHGKL